MNPKPKRPMFVNCPKCSLANLTRSELARHMKRSHPAPVAVAKAKKAEEKTGKVFTHTTGRTAWLTCQKCGMTGFVNSSDLKMHARLHDPGHKAKQAEYSRARKAKLNAAKANIASGVVVTV